MTTLAKRLMLAERHIAQGSLPTAVFGSAGRLSQAISLGRSPYRIGLWPVLSAEHPELAMGINSVLALLLERWQDITVYRLFIQHDLDTEFEWTIARSQFDIDAWQPEDLDENVAISGQLIQDDAGYGLKLIVENDLAEDDDDERTFEIPPASLPDFLNALPDMVQQIVEYVGATRLDVTIPTMPDDATQSAALAANLEQVFQWEIALLQDLLNDEATLDDLRKPATALIEKLSLNSGVDAWLIAASLSRAISPRYGDRRDALVPQVSEVLEEVAMKTPATIIFATALHRIRLTQQAYDLLENLIEEGAEDASPFLALAGLYRRGGQFDAAIETYQEAIDSELVSAALYQAYAQLLVALDLRGEYVEIAEWALLDPEEAEDEDALLLEAVEAYIEAHEQDPTNVRILSDLLLQLADLGLEEDFWAYFDVLVPLDHDGDSTRSIIDALYGFESLQPAIVTLQNASAASPDRVSLQTNLAALHLLNDDASAAVSILKPLSTKPLNAVSLSDVQQLLLSAEIPDFERRLVDIQELLDAGRGLATDQVDFLEDVVERAPTYATGHLSLARAYIAWKAESDALETILDALDTIPNDPDLLDLAGQLIWESGDEELAFEYLNRGLEANPNHISLLVRAGRYLYELGEVEAARVYLSRAEIINPRSLFLQETRKWIAQNSDT